MLALVCDGKCVLKTDYDKPRPASDEVLVAVRTAGICRTDLEILAGYMDFRGVMGHEFVGTVVEGPARWKNKRVTAEINCACGRCDMCTRGLANHCRHRTVLGIDGHDGVFAEYVAVPVGNLHEIPEGLDDEQAVFVEPLAAALQIVRQVEIRCSDSVVVLGDGRLGQLVARVIKDMLGGARMVGRHAERLTAAAKQGIETVAVEQFVPRAEADVVIDATGRAAGFDLAMRTVRPRGTIVLKSTFAGGKALDLAPLVVNELTVVGSRCGPFGEAIEALATGRIDPAALVSKRFPLSQAIAAVEAAGRPENIKVLIDVGRQRQSD